MKFTYTPDQWQLFSPNQSPEEFYREITKGLPENTVVNLVLRQGVPMSIYLSHEEDKERSFQFHHNILLEYANVEHFRSDVSPKMQGEGISRIINRNLMPFYQRLGIERILLNPINVGTYAWPRMGFLPTWNKWRDIKRNVSARLDHLELHPCPEKGPLPHKYLLTLREALKDDSPKALWFIVDQNIPYYGTTLGKLLTVERTYLPEAFKRKAAFAPLNFSAMLNLKDSDSMQRMQAYLGIAQKKKPDAKPAPGFPYKM